MRQLLRVMLVLGAMIAASVLPIVPAMFAPVVPNPVYNLRFTSILDVVSEWLFPRPGISQRLEWFTWATMLGALAITLVVSIFVSKVLTRKPNEV